MDATLALVPEAAVAVAPRPRRHAWLGLVFLAGLGLFVSGYLAWSHMGSRTGFGAGLCSAGAFDCDSVARSHYGELFGVPLAAFGFGFYLLVAGLGLLAAREGGSTAGRREAVRWVLSLAVVALVLDAYLLGAMLFELEALCSLCLITYGLNASILALVAMGMPHELAPARPGRGRVLGGGVVLGAMFLVPAFGGEVPEMPDGDELAALVEAADEELDAEAFLDDRELKAKLVEAFRKAPQPVVDPELYEGPSRGAVEPEYEIAIFGDFQCPYCRKLAGYVDELLEQQGDRVRVVFKHFPLNEDCNPHVPSRMHENACSLAAAAITAAEEGDRSFWQAHDRMFQAKGQLEGEGLSPERRARIERDVELGHRLGVRSIPAVFVDHRRIPDYRFLHPELFGLLEEVLGALGDESYVK